MISNHMIVLMQAEVERFHAGTALLHDYHHIKMQEVADKESIVLVSIFFCHRQGFDRVGNRFLVFLPVFSNLLSLSLRLLPVGRVNFTARIPPHQNLRARSHGPNRLAW